MDPDVLTFICSLLDDDIDKFSLLSINKRMDKTKKITWFDNRVHLYRIYRHLYYYRFRSVIVCEKMWRFTGDKKPFFHENIKRIEFATEVKYLHNVFWEGITHIKLPDLQKLGTPKIPSSVTHLSIPSRFDSTKLFFPDNLIFLHQHGCSRYHQLKLPLTLETLGQYIFDNCNKYPPNIVNLSLYKIGINTLSTNLVRLFVYEINFKTESLENLINLRYLCIPHCIGKMDNKLPPNMTHFIVMNVINATLSKLPNTITHLYQNNLMTALEYHKNLSSGNKIVSRHHHLDLPNLIHLSTIYTDFIENHNFPKLAHVTCRSKYYINHIPSIVRSLKFSDTCKASEIPSFITHLSFRTLNKMTISTKRIPNNITHLDLGQHQLSDIDEIFPESLSHVALSPECYTKHRDFLRSRGIAVTINHVFENDPFEENIDKIFDH